MFDPFATAKNTLRTNAITGKNKISIPDLINDYPEFVSINAVEKFVNEADEPYYAMTFAEDNNAFFFTAGDLTKLAEQWIETAGSVADVNESLQDRPVKLKIQRVKSSKGKYYYTKATLIGDNPSKDDLPF